MGKASCTWKKVSYNVKKVTAKTFNKITVF